MYPTITPDKNFRQLQGSRTTPNRHINDDSMASQSPDMSSEIISVFMDDDGTFTYNTDLVPPPKTTNCMRHTMTQHDSPAKVFAKLKSQIQRERRNLTEVTSNHPVFGSNLLPKPHLSCEKRVSEDEVLDLKRDQEFKNIGSSTVRRRLIKGQGCCPQMEKPTSAVYKENDVPDTATMGLGFGRVVGNALPYNLDMTASRADGPDSQTPVTADPLLCHNFPQICISNKNLWVKLEKLPPMSPAKLFVHIKENERNRRIHKAGCGTTTIHRRGLFQPQDRSTSTAFHKDVMELKSSMGDVRCVPGSADPISESKLEGADDPGEDFQPVVVDPLLVSSPSICFRKKREGVFKWPAKPSIKRPQKGKVIGVYLTGWMLKSNSAGLYVDGILKDDKQPWHSSVIVERLSNTVLKTTSANTYILVGRMAMSMDSELPQWLLKKFADGFPEDWRLIYDKFKSESIREKSSKVVNQSVKVKPQKTNVRRTAVSSHSCTPTSSAKTRSGRMIITPLDYWRGGRVIVDKDMNMTIHDSYETTVSLPEVQAEVTVSRSNCDEDTVSNASEMAPLRKVKPPPRHRNGARAKPDKQTGGHNEPLNTDLSIPEGFSRRSTSIAGITAMQPTLYTDCVPEASSRQRSINPKRQSTRKDPPISDQASDSNDDSWAPPHSQIKGTKAFGETGSRARKNVNDAKVKEDDEDQWSEAELARLKKAVNLFPNHLGSFWDNVAQMVATRSAEECQREHMSQGVVITGRTKKTKTSRKKEPVNEPGPPKITAGVGTLKRKQQVRQLIKAMPKEDYDDAFTNASMFANVFQFPATLSADESDDEFVFPGLEPVTPGTSSSGFPTVKTPLCHHITEDMLGSVDRDNDDRSVYRLQKRMKKCRANVHCAVKDIKVKKSEKRRLIGEHNSFTVKETRPDSESAESGEEDFYFDLD